MKIRFFKCKVCGKVIGIFTDSGTPTICCGQEMIELQPGTSDGASEKHVPVISTRKETVEVNVGSLPHPMEEKHFIKWIALQTKDGIQFKCLKPGDEPKACFSFCSTDKYEQAFAYCNLHELWSSK